MTPEELIKELGQKSATSTNHRVNITYESYIQCVRTLLTRVTCAEKALGEIRANLPTPMGKLHIGDNVHNSHPEAVSMVSEMLRTFDALSLILKQYDGGQDDNR